MTKRKTEKCLSGTFAKKWLLFIDKKITFFGVLFNNFYAFSHDWNESTQKDYITKYQKHILPELNNVPIDQLTEETIRILFRKLELRFSDSQMDHLQMLTNLVLFAAAANNLIGFSPWGSDIELNRTQRQQIVGKILKGWLPRSFTISEQLTIFKELTTDPMQSGAKMALLLMLICGLRNSEAGGVMYRNVFEHPSRKNEYYLALINTSNADHSIDASFKSANGPRIIPIPAFLYQFILQRKELIQRKIDNGSIRLPVGKSIDSLPIACLSDFVTHCNTQNITYAGKKMFQKIGYEAENYYLADHLAARNAKDEKDPTAYLFRRNFCTNMTIAEMPQTPLEYLMGHSIEDQPFDPRFLLAEKPQHAIRQIMHRCPLFNLSYDADADRFQLDTFYMTKEEWLKHARNNAIIKFQEYNPGPDLYMQHFEDAVNRFNKKRT